MKKFFLLASLTLIVFTGIAQTDATRYAELITTADLQKHLNIIASAEMEGRETGTEGQRKAAVYIESQFKAIGLQRPASLKSYQQLYPLHQDSLLTTSLTINKVTAEYGKDYITPLMYNQNGSFKSSDVVFVGYGIDDAAYSDYTNLNVKGKVVVFFLGEPKKDGKFFINPTGRSSTWTSPGISKKLEAAAAKGATGAFIISPSQESFSQQAIDRTRKTALYFPLKKNDPRMVNFASLSHAFAKTFIANFDTLLQAAKASNAFSLTPSNTKTAIRFSFKKYLSIVNASNVLGIVEGSDKKNEYIFVTAHYDHLGMRDGKIFYGADDDGSGTVAVIQMAQAFAKAKAEGKGPRRTIVFMTVSGEEKGLWGSEYYSDHPVFPLEKTSVDLNIDMIGRIDTERKTEDSLNYVYVVGHDKLSSDLPLINEAMNNQYTKLTLDYKFDDPKDPYRIYFRSDHYNFARKGVPVLFFYDGMLKADYHKTTDTIDKINWQLFEKRAKMIFYTAWDMANRDDMLKRDIPLTNDVR